MNQRVQLQRAALLALAMATAVLVFAKPQVCAQALQQGLQLCGGPLLVSLFPFLIVSTLLMRCGAGRLGTGADAGAGGAVRAVRHRCAARRRALRQCRTDRDPAVRGAAPGRGAIKIRKEIAWQSW